MLHVRLVLVRSHVTVHTQDVYFLNEVVILHLESAFIVLFDIKAEGSLLTTCHVEVQSAQAIAICE